MRIGHGFDAHRFEAGRRLVLGGVEIEHPYGLAAHSDGDVVIHALCDALLGAGGLGDLGVHFPADDPRFAGVDSRELLREVRTALAGKGLVVVNADLTVIAEAPRLRPHVAEMRSRLASDLGVGRGRVNVKATTTEGMGFCGRGEGIAAHAVALVGTEADAVRLSPSERERLEGVP